MTLAPQFILLGVGALGGWLLDGLDVPAGWMLGALAVGVITGLVRGYQPPLSRSLQMAAQAVVGVRLGGTVGPEMLPLLSGFLPAVVLFTLALLGASIAAGLTLARLARLPRATGVLAFVPGGASAMVAMSPEVGADARVVATVQYVRLVLVGLSAPLIVTIARGLAPALPIPGEAGLEAGAAAGGPAGWEGLLPSLVTYGALLGGIWFSGRLPIPAGRLLFPMALLLGATLVGVPHAPLPAWLNNGALVLLGLWVGLQFDRASLKRAGLTALWAVVLTLGLMVVGLLLGLGVAAGTQVTLETALLGTTPGAIETMTAVALEVASQPALVMAMQLFRMLGAVLVGPPLVKALARPQPAPVSPERGSP